MMVESWTATAYQKKLSFHFQLALKGFRMICCAVNETTNLHLRHPKREETVLFILYTVSFLYKARHIFCQIDYHMV